MTVVEWVNPRLTGLKKTDQLNYLSGIYRSPMCYQY